MQLVMDHLVVCAESLTEGVVYVEDMLAVSLSGGGEHSAMGTHNRLLSLGPELYLEVIAINPDAPAPGRARWFGLDDFRGPPQLTNWVVRCDDLRAAVAAAPRGTGDIMALQRGDLRWEMAVPGDGRLPFDGAFPGLIAWQGAAHPAARLTDQGCRLQSLSVYHPDADELLRHLGPALSGSVVRIARGAARQLEAHIQLGEEVRVLR